MAKARWRRRNGLILARRRWTIRPNISARRMAFAIIVEGARPQQVCNVFRWCGLAVPTSAQIYSEMRIVCTHIKAMANPSNISFQVISKLVAAIDEFSLEREESLLPLSSALEALATTSKDMSYHAVNRLQSKLETSMNCMKTQLTTLSRRDILLVSERLVKFRLYLFEVPFFSRSTLINVSNSCGLH